MWTQNKLSLRDRIKILFGWKIYTRFDAPTGQCSGGCDMRHQITLAKYDDVRWPVVPTGYQFDPTENIAAAQEIVDSLGQNDQALP